MSKPSETDLTKIELALDKYDSEESLRKFVERGWHVLHPGIEEVFVGGYCLDAICDHLQAISDGYLRKLIINVPPGCTKSMTTAVYWPAWEWGPRKRPERKFLDGAYVDSLTLRDNRRFRNLITSNWYTHNWGDKFSLSGDQNEKKKVENDRTGWKIATSVGGAATGERGNVFIIDDPHNVKDSESDLKRESALFWLSEVVPTRMVNYKTGVFVLIMQRIHEKDCTSLLQDQGYMHLRLPMEYEKGEKCITYAKNPRSGKEFRFEDWREEEGELLWPERMPAEVVDELKANMTPYAVAAQLQQRPSPRGGGMIKRQDLKMIPRAPVGLEYVRGWDLADTASITAAYTAGVRLGRDHDGNFYIEDAIRFQEEDSYKGIRNIASQDGHSTEISIPQDPGSAGKFVARYIKKHLAGYAVKSSQESGDKVSRLRPFADQVEAGNVFIVQGDWNEAYLNELTKFPYSATKDFSDATSRAFAALAMKPLEDGDSIGIPEAVT